jgi:hypothetical protein
VDWKILRSKFDSLSETSVIVATTIGVSPVLINRLAQGASLKDDTPANREKLRIHRRFWIALMLQHLIKEEPLSKVAERFGAEFEFYHDRVCEYGADFLLKTWVGESGIVAWWI